MDNGNQMDETWIAQLVKQVLYRIASVQASDDYALAVFTGATAGFKESLESLEQLMVQGISLRVLLSESANHMYGDVVKKRILPWPNAMMLDSTTWFSQVQEAKGVIIPMLSVSSLSKACALMADSLATNIILQAAFMGKPLIAAIDGALPGNKDRTILRLNQGTAPLQQALADRLVQFSDFGCSLARSTDLAAVAMKHLGKEESRIENRATAKVTPRIARPQSTSISAKGMVDATMVRAAKRQGCSSIVLSSGKGVVTPLARELAVQLGVEIQR